MLGVPVLGPFTRSCCFSAFFCKESFWNLCVASCWSCFLFDKTLSLNCSSWFCSSFFLSSRALWRIHIHHLTTCPKNFYAPIRTPFSDTFIYFYHKPLRTLCFSKWKHEGKHELPHKKVTPKHGDGVLVRFKSCKKTTSSIILNNLTSLWIFSIVLIIST